MDKINRTPLMINSKIPYIKLIGKEMKVRSMTYSDVIIKRLNDLCNQREITVNKLSTLSGITQSTVENIMSGKTKNPKLKTLHKLAVGLDMTVSELLDFPEMNETIFDDE